MVQTLGQITLGRSHRCVELGGLRLLECCYEPERVLRPHAHRSGNVSLVLEGEFEEWVGGQRTRPRSASFVLKPGGTVHSNRYGSRAVRAFVMEIDPLRQREIGLDRRGPARWVDGGRGVGVLLEIYRAFREGPDDLEDLTLERLRDVVRSSGEVGAARTVGVRATEILQRADRILRAQLAAPPDSRELAARVGVHPVYLARLFRAVHGCGTAAYRRKLQVRDAARRLAESSNPQADLARASGFADQSHLCRAFKAELGLTPGAYRNLLQNSKLAP